LEILEIRPLNNRKKVKLYLIRGENKGLNEVQYENLRELLEEEKFRFAIIDFNDKQMKKSYETPLQKFLEKFMVPYYTVDVPENAKDYLYVDVLEREVQLNELEIEYEDLCSDPEGVNTFKAQNLKAWIDMLKKELENKKEYIRKTITSQWIVKKVLDIANQINNDKFSIMHFTHEEIYTELKKVFEEHKVRVMKIDINKMNVKEIIV
jgi:hypothetical protein